MTPRGRVTYSAYPSAFRLETLPTPPELTRQRTPGSFHWGRYEKSYTVGDNEDIGGMVRHLRISLSLCDSRHIWTKRFGISMEALEWIPVANWGVDAYALTARLRFSSATRWRFCCGAGVVEVWSSIPGFLAVSTRPRSAKHGLRRKWRRKRRRFVDLI